ncbi:MAG: DNA-3-methyladenine glycosylase 2 family protein [Acidimicrobiia bacterium]
MLTRTIRFEARLDLRSTLKPITFPWGRFTDRGWVRPTRTPAGSATLLVRRDGDGIHGSAWGDGAEWVLDRLDGWVGLRDDPESFVPSGRLGELHRRRLGVRFACTGLVFEAALVAVLAQKVTGKEAVLGLRGLMARFSESAPGPYKQLVLPPDPALLATAPYHSFHDLGIEKRRSDTVRRLAAESVRVDQMAAMPSEAAAVALRRFPGVGEWTVAETVAVSHGDADALSVGDFHLKHLVSWHLTGRARGTDKLMVELLEPYRPHRGRVVRLLEAAGRYPSYGPRQPLRSFATY